MNKSLKKIIRENLPVNIHSLLKENRNQKSAVYSSKSDFYQTNYSLCKYPQKPISKII